MLKMMKLIKNNMMYLFIFKTVSILVVSSIIWIGLLYAYNSYKVANNI